MPDHRTATAQRNLETILGAAETVLRERRRMSIAAVAAEAGVSRVTVYAHFSDRNRLLETVVERAVRQAMDAVEQVEPERGPASEALQRVIAASWEQISRFAEIGDAAVAELSPAAMRRSHEAGRAIFYALIERGRREGDFRTDLDAEWLISAIFALIQAAHDEVGAGRLDREAASTALTRSIPPLVSS